MEEKKLQQLPPGYTNLAYDDELAGPSAPKVYDESAPQEYDDESVPGPSAPMDEDSAPQECPPPPPWSPPMEQLSSSSSSLVYNPPTLVFEDIYDACVQYVKRHCCYGSRFVKQMKLTEIENRAVYHYTLESFGEKRQSTNHTEPYKGGRVDGPENGPPPGPWSIAVTPPERFKACTGRTKIPHTERVSTCHKCGGTGKVVCSSCSGCGTSRCFSCGGSGMSDNRSCNSCSGRGRRTCWVCGGSGRVKCSKCKGYGSLIHSRMLLLTWENHKADYASDALGDLPIDKVRAAMGICLVSLEREQLDPIVNAPEESVNTASASMLRMHQTSLQNERIIRQRHILRAIPSTRVKYQWKEKEGEFYVYDIERKVYFEDYPQPCCCCTCC